MINVDLRRYGTDKEYEQFINGYLAGSDIDEEQEETLKGDEDEGNSNDN